MRNRPSRVQSVGNLSLKEETTTCGSPLPLAGFSYRSRIPREAEVKTIRLASGDQSGARSAAGSKVKRDHVVRMVSKIQMSVFVLPSSRIATAILFSSGESRGVL